MPPSFAKANASSSSDTRGLALPPQPTPPQKTRTAPPHRHAKKSGAPALDLLSLPTECLVEVLRNLEVDELLEVAWTCRRVAQAAQDSALWTHTRFTTADWAVLQRHFVPDLTRRTKDHTGVWTRCVCRLTQVCRRYLLAHASPTPPGNPRARTACPRRSTPVQPVPVRPPSAGTSGARQRGREGGWRRVEGPAPPRRAGAPSSVPRGAEIATLAVRGVPAGEPDVPRGGARLRRPRRGRLLSAAALSELFAAAAPSQRRAPRAHLARAPAQSPSPLL